VRTAPSQLLICTLEVVPVPVQKQKPAILIAEFRQIVTGSSLVCLQLEFARSLADEFLTDAAAKMSAAAADPNTAAGWLEQRQGVRALAWRLEGAVSGLRSSLVDYDHDGVHL
jgi:hypothetical protein